MVKVIYFLYLSLYLTESTVFSGFFQESDHVKANLIAEVQSIQPGQSFSVGVLLELEKDWHTYWQNPGDSGLPIDIKWKLPSGFIPGDVQWPYPDRFGTESVMNFGYFEEVLLITEIQASPSVNPGETVSIEADIEWLVCKEECLPGSAGLTLSLPVQNKEPSFDPVWAKKFMDTRMKLPIRSTDWSVRATVKKNHAFLSITFPPSFKNEMKDIYFFPEQSELFDYSAPQLFEKTEDGYIIQVRISVRARNFPYNLKGVLVSDKSWIHESDYRALRIVVPLAQHSEDKITHKEVIR